MRSKEEITTEYAKLCITIGDVRFQIRLLNSRLRILLADAEVLNTEMQGITLKEKHEE